MAGKETKIATVIIKVDLECSCCSKKIKSALCKLQKRFKIDSIAFDEKKGTIIVSGPFDPDRFIKEICCLAHKVIKDIEIKKPEPPKPEPEKSKPKPPPPPPEVDVKISLTTCCGQPWPHQCSKPCPQQCPQPCPKPCPQPCPEPCPPKPCPPKPCPEPCPPKPCPEPCPPQPCSLPCCQPCPPPCPKPCPQLCPLPCCQPCLQPPQFGGYPCYKIVCEEEPSGGCSIM